MVKNSKILIIDDEQNMCNSLKTMLCAQNYEVEICSSGSKALTLLGENKFDLILLDIVMEEMDGFKVFEKILHQKIDSAVIIMTGNASTDSSVKALRMGASDYLKKPFGPEELFTSVKNVLKHKKIANDLSYSNKMHKILMHIATVCINVQPGRKKEAIQSALEEIGKFVSADRTYVFDYDFEKNIAVNTYEWCNTGVEPQIENLQSVPLENFPDFVAPHFKGEPLIIPDVSALPSGATKEILEQQNIKSLVTAPLFNEGSLIGFTGFDSIKKFHAYSEREIELLQFFAQILVNLRVHTETEKKLLFKENIIRSSSSPIATCDLDGTMTFGNPAFMKTWGFVDPKEFLGRPFWEYWAVGDKLNEIIQALQDIVSWYGEVRAVLQDGSFLDVQFVVSTVLDRAGNPVAITATSIDITERKHAEKMLLKSELKHKTLLNNIPGMVYRAYPDWSADIIIGCHEISGYNVTEFNTGENNWFDIIHPDDRKQILKESSVLMKPANITQTYRIITKSGDLRWVEDHKVSLFSIEGKLIAIDGIVFDITKRKQAKERLRESEAKYRSLVEFTNAIPWKVDLNSGRFTYMAPQVEKILGYPANGWLDINTWAERIHSEDRQQALDYYNTASQQGKDYEFEYRTITADGQVVWIKDIVTVKMGEDGPKELFGVMINITETKKMEDEVVKARKLEALGALAGGLAHDFNNLLFAVSGNVSIAQKVIESEMGISEELQEAEKACLKAKELTARLITFSKGGDPVMKASFITDLLKDTVGSSLLGSDIKSEFFIDDDIRQAYIDENQIRQVIRNIVVNAQEAMDDKGQLKIICSNIDITQKENQILNQDKYIKITIKDQGCGISKENLEKIFDPYVSTKDMGTNKGQGLGLTVSYSIVQKHKGLITVESEFGKGSIFSIYLPAASSKTTTESSSEPEKKIISQKSSKKPVTDKGKVLLMDDEEMIRKFMDRVLNSLGYDVETCIEGKEAIEIYTNAMESANPFDVAILDLTNKLGMGGQEAMRRLLEIDPSAKGIIITGYSDDPVATNYRTYGFSGYIAKPSTNDEMSRVISEVISKG